MKRLLFICCLVFVCTLANSQQPSVPFRSGNRFGIADINGRMLVPAQFDIIDVVSLRKNCYIAYTFTNGKALSSLIYNNKIIIRDKRYRDYSLTGNLVTATSYAPARKQKRRRSDWEKQNNFSKTEHLYGTDGKLMMAGDFSDINVADNINDNPIQNELIIMTTDTNERQSLYVYSIKTRKIMKTLFEDSEIMEMGYSEAYQHDNVWRSFIYKDGEGLKKIVLSAPGNKLSITKPVAATLPKQDAYGNFDMGAMGIDQVPEMMPPPPPKLNNTDSVLLKIAFIRIDRGFYYSPKKIEHIIEVRYNTLETQGPHIVLKDGKQGMKYGDKEAFFIAPEYDEIYQAEFSGSASGYVLRSGNKYGLYLYGRGDGTLIAPVFDKRPLMLDQDYFDKAHGLIRLYDEQGNFFCYADSKGKVYYSEK